MLVAVDVDSGSAANVDGFVAVADADDRTGQESR